MDILWGILNLLFIITFLYVGYKAVVLVKREMGYLPMIILIVGILSVIVPGRRQSEEPVSGNYRQYTAFVPLNAFQKVHVVFDGTGRGK